MKSALSDNNQTEISRAAAVYGGLALFGLAYNALTGWLEEKGLAEGYTSDLVVGGVLVTVTASAPIVGIRRAALVLGCFVASGLPMVIGARVRYRRWRERERGYVNVNTTEVTGAAAWQRPAAKA